MLAERKLMRKRSHFLTKSTSLRPVQGVLFPNSGKDVYYGRAGVARGSQQLFALRIMQLSHSAP